MNSLIYHIVIGALLPEVLQRITWNALYLTLMDAESYLEKAFMEPSDEFMMSVKAKVFGQKKA